MKKMKVFTAVLLTLALSLAGAAAIAEDGDFSEIAGIWYTEEIMMTVTEEGRFNVGWNDGDWTGSLEADWRTDEDGEEYTVYRMTLDDPGLSIWADLELVQDLYHPGKLTYYQDGNVSDYFYDVPVCVEEMAEEDLVYYEPYAFVDASDGEEPAVTMMFTFLRPATDIAVMRMYDQAFDDEGNFGYNGDTLEWWAQLDSQERIVVKHVFEGDMPELSLSFIGEDGTGYDFAVQISGADGEIELWQLEAPQG